MTSKQPPQPGARTELCARLDGAAERLTSRVLAEMYVNPFWIERFGERAQRHGRQDGRYHIDYLIQALGADDPAIIENYARWLQQVLTSRGMCSRHLAENFDRLAHAIADEQWPDGEAAVVMLASATQALRYTSGPARAVTELASVLVHATADVLFVRHPEPLAHWALQGRARCVDDLAYHVSYAADALALGSSTTFVHYCLWIADFLARRDVPREHLVESLEVLREVPDAPHELVALLGEAVSALAR